MDFDPSLIPAEKLRANLAETPQVDGATLKGRIADLVRADSKERKVPTQEHAILELAPDLSREQLGEILNQIANDAAFADIKAVVAPSGRFYLFSEASLSRNEAAEHGYVEEAKLAIVEKIRKDSQYVALTAAAELDQFFPAPEPEKRAALLAEIGTDQRFRDIQTLTGVNGEVHFHSDRYLSDNYGKIMKRAKANDAGLAIAELVRDRSRIMPAPTKLALFNDAVFMLSPAQIEAFVEGLSRPDAVPEYADIKKLVHPTTGAVYLYSDKWLNGDAAFRVMDWDEVGAAQNP
jgi:hypothetical protein